MIPTSLLGMKLRTSVQVHLPSLLGAAPDVILTRHHSTIREVPQAFSHLRFLLHQCYSILFFLQPRFAESYPDHRHQEVCERIPFSLEHMIFLLNLCILFWSTELAVTEKLYSDCVKGLRSLKEEIEGLFDITDIWIDLVISLILSYTSLSYCSCFRSLCIKYSHRGI